MMPTGTVKWYDAQKGYGFITPDDGSRNIFVHASALQELGARSPKEGQRLSYQLKKGNRGMFAVALRTVERRVQDVIARDAR